MARYEVVRPWHGVKLGDVFETEKLHPSLKSNVRPIKGQAAELVPATPGAKTEPANRKSAVCKRLKELEIQFDGRKGVDELIELLPEGELEKLFPGE